MLRSFSVAKGLIPLVVIALLSSNASAAVFNLYNDWSDTNNPNGVWTYEQKPGTVLTNHVPDWDTARNVWTLPQPAWAPGNESQPGNFLPGFMKDVNNTAAAGIDAPSGHAYMHNNDPSNSPPGFGTLPAGISWTSPQAGTITITGDMWEAQRSLGRSEDWSLNKNGAFFTSGVLTPNNNTSASPLLFSSGTGGPGVLTLTVNAGDIIEFQLQRDANTAFGTVIGLDWNIVLTPSGPSVPEPSGLALLTVGTVLGVAGYRRRRGNATTS